MLNVICYILLLFVYFYTVCGLRGLAVKALPYDLMLVVSSPPMKVIGSRQEGHSDFKYHNADNCQQRLSPIFGK